MHDDGYQGRDAYGPRTATPEQDEIAGLSQQITMLEEQVQDAEDRDNLKRAWAIGAKIPPLKARLATLVAAQVAK